MRLFIYSSSEESSYYSSEQQSSENDNQAEQTSLKSSPKFNQKNLKANINRNSDEKGLNSDDSIRNEFYSMRKKFRKSRKTVTGKVAAPFRRTQDLDERHRLSITIMHKGGKLLIFFKKILPWEEFKLKLFITFLSEDSIKVLEQRVGEITQKLILRQQFFEHMHRTVFENLIRFHK